MSVAAVSEDWKARDFMAQDADPSDLIWVRETLDSDMARNSYFHGTPADKLTALALAVVRGVRNGDWMLSIVTTSDEDAEPAGWVIYRQIPALTIAHAFVEESFRGLGAWRVLREHIGLKRGQLVNVVLASPQAMSQARKVYMAKHNWGHVLTWLA